MTIVDPLEQIWTEILDVTSLFVIPDWGALIGLLPVFILLGRRRAAHHAHRCSARSSTGPQAADQGHVRGGPAARRRSTPTAQPIFPPGLPYCRARRADLPVRDASLRRATGELSRSSARCAASAATREIDTCSNCGLVLKVKTPGDRDPDAGRPAARAAAAAA